MRSEISALFSEKTMREYIAGGIYLIRVENLVKEYQYHDKENKLVCHKAVDGLSLQINEGEIFGLLGPNGAGKTTTINILTMLNEPTSGKVFFSGIELGGRQDKDLKQMIGVVPQHINFDQDLTVGENMELHARLYHLGRLERKQRINKLLDYVGLKDASEYNIRMLSGGMKRRLLIARAMIHKPRILFLDEPTVALDPQVRRRIWNLIRHLAQEKVTVLLTTHYIEEAESLCQRVAVLNEGKLIAMDTPKALCQRIGSYTVEYDNISGKHEYRYFFSQAEADGFKASIDGKAVVRQVNLEDVFVELTGRKAGL